MRQFILCLMEQNFMSCKDDLTLFWATPRVKPLQNSHYTMRISPSYVKAFSNCGAHRYTDARSNCN